MGKRHEDIESVYVTPTEASKLLGRSRSTIYRWIEQGHLKLIPVGPSEMLSREQLLRPLRQAEAAPATPKIREAA